MRTIDLNAARDGSEIVRGGHYHLLARLADPLEMVEVVGLEFDQPSLIDGLTMTRYVVRTPRGSEFVVEPWQLSSVPPDELYRQLLRGGPSNPFRLSVSPVRLSA